MIVLKLKKKNTGPDNIIDHFSCLKRNIRARYILNFVYCIRSVYSLANLSKDTRELNTDVFEPRTSTGCRNFSSSSRITPFSLKMLSRKC